MITDTVLLAAMHLIVRTNSNLIAPGEDVSQFTPQEISDRIYGSKLVLVVEQMQLVTIWLIKACLLIMYKRMTVFLPQHKIVLITAAYTGLTFVVMEILYFAVWCRPFSQYWAVPPNNPQCSAATHHLITNAVFNISSDLIIISIPLPLLFKVRLPLKNKAVLLGIFAIGAFTIIAAALNKYYSFTHPFGQEWTIWYLRESYTALLCANLPLIYPLIQRVFNLKNWSHRSYNSKTHRTASAGFTSHNQSRNTRSKPRSIPLGSRTGVLSRTESQEDFKFDMNRTIDENKIEVATTVTVAFEHKDKQSPSVSSVDQTSEYQNNGGENKRVDPYRAV